MRIKKLHITLLFLILGIFSFQSLELEVVPASNFLLEVENEEEIDEINECNFEKELSFSIADDDGGSSFLFEVITSFQNYLKGCEVFLQSYSEAFIQKSNLFILYCCLKIDC